MTGERSNEQINGLLNLRVQIKVLLAHHALYFSKSFLRTLKDKARRANSHIKIADEMANFCNKYQLISAQPELMDGSISSRHVTLERLSDNLQPEYENIEKPCDEEENENKNLVLALVNEDEPEEDNYDINFSLVDHSWSRKILELVSNKAKLKESFSWLSTVGGGFSALGERDANFSMKAGCLSLGQQLRLADLLGDERLKVMCHLFAALAFIQMNNKQFCINYIKRVIIPLIKALPHRDPILINMFRHICFRIQLDLLKGHFNIQAIEGRK